MVLILSQGVFYLSCCPGSEELMMSKKLREDTARRADPNWPKGYAVPYGVILNNKSWGKEGVCVCMFKVTAFIFTINCYTC